jgi:hypothetical protein
MELDLCYLLTTDILRWSIDFLENLFTSALRIYSLDVLTLGDTRFSWTQLKWSLTS